MRSEGDSRGNGNLFWGASADEGSQAEMLNALRQCARRVLENLISRVFVGGSSSDNKNKYRELRTKWG